MRKVADGENTRGKSGKGEGKKHWRPGGDRTHEKKQKDAEHNIDSVPPVLSQSSTPFTLIVLKGKRYFCCPYR